MSTFGERCAEDVRCYLNTNGLTQSKLTGATLSELIDRRLKHETIQAKKKKRLATEEDWIVELESEPHLAGVNVRKELAAAQFWCKNNARQCTRKFFVNWLNRAEKSSVVSGGGAKSPTEKPVGQMPKEWLRKLNERYPDCTYAKGGIFEIKAETEYTWKGLPLVIRETLSALP